MRLVVRGGLGHAGEGKRGMWHDKSAGLGHAGEGKMVCGMTGWGEAPRKKEKASGSEVQGNAPTATLCRQDAAGNRVVDWRQQNRQLRSQREGKHPGREKIQVVPR